MSKSFSSEHVCTVQFRECTKTKFWAFLKMVECVCTGFQHMFEVLEDHIISHPTETSGSQKVSTFMKKHGKDLTKFYNQQLSDNKKPSSIGERTSKVMRVS